MNIPKGSVATRSPAHAASPRSPPAAQDFPWRSSNEILINFVYKFGDFLTLLHGSFARLQFLTFLVNKTLVIKKPTVNKKK